MTLQMILDSIGAWSSLRDNQDATQINALFSVGNYFKYTRETPKNVETEVGKIYYMHAYMGVFENKLKIFMIDAANDTQAQYESPEGILPYITVCSLHEETGNVGGEITKQEAMLRIGAWNADHETWIENKVETPENIFQAFAIPESDLHEGQQLKIYFALKANPSPEIASADLVVVEKTGTSAKQVLYYDMVRPVPPFGSFAQSNFYLLEIS